MTVAALPTGTNVEPGQWCCAQTARVGAEPVISSHAAYVNGQGTASYWEGYAPMCAWLYLRFKMYILSNVLCHVAGLPFTSKLTAFRS